MVFQTCCAAQAGCSVSNGLVVLMCVAHRRKLAASLARYMCELSAAHTDLSCQSAIQTVCKLPALCHTYIQGVSTAMVTMITTIMVALRHHVSIQEKAGAGSCTSHSSS